MHFYWVRDRIKHGHYRIFLKSGKDNLKDYFTKIILLRVIE